MFRSILKLSVTYRYIVLIVTAVAALIGAASYQHLVIDAVPDITNVQVQINTEALGYSPFEAEQRITAPLELALAGLPNLEYTRSLSRYGLSQVTVAFHDGTDIHFARQLVAQRIQEAKDRLPPDVSPTMGPISTGLGEIFMFTVENKENAPIQRSLHELREIQDWVVKPQLRTVPGVVEVNSIGGAAKQIVITPRLEQLRAFGFTFQDLALAVQRNNGNVGAGFIEHNGEQLLLRSPASIETPREIEDFVVRVHEGTPILVRDVADVAIGSELRGGAATQNGREVVLGTVFMLIGENGRAVSERVSARLTEIAPSLPEGVQVTPVYNRSTLVNATIGTVQKNLIEGALLVIIILFLALGNVRAALITAMVIPLSMILTIFGMVQGNLSANLMSLGALDFGLLVDGAVILVENCIKRFGEERARLGRSLSPDERLDLTYQASVEVRETTLFGEIIIMVVYVPILALTGVEGKMYHPMAFTVLLALGVAFILSLTFVPAAVAVCITRDIPPHADWIERAQGVYRAILHRLIEVPRRVTAAALLVFLLTLFIATRLGSEFAPSLDEGDIALHALRVPGTSLTQAIAMQHRLEEAIKEIPEVSHVFAKLGTAEIATDPVPPSVADGFVILKPRSQWSNPKKPKSEIVQQIEELVTHIPGNNYEFTQPIQMRFNELIAGVRSDVAVKVFGDNADTLREYGEEIESIIRTIDGASDTKVEQTTGLPMIVVKPSREKMARLGLAAADIQDTLRTAYAGEEVSRFYQGDRNFPIVVRLREEDRHDPEEIQSLPVPLHEQPSLHAPTGDTKRTEIGLEPPHLSSVNLRDVADISLIEGPNQISRESGKRRVVVTANVRDRDLGSFVAEAQRRVSAEVQLPAGYWLSWGGQYENLISAQRKLTLIVPVVLITVFAFIYVTFGSIRYSLLVFSGVPFALSGGILALWLRGIPFSISAAVGFIALSGVSVLNGLVLVGFTRRVLASTHDTVAAIIEGASSRLRPVLMTASVASLGFIPMAIAQGTGSEVQRPLATVVIGGIISSTVLTLLVLPCMMRIFVGKDSMERGASAPLP